MLAVPDNPGDVNPGISKRRYSSTHGSPANMGKSIIKPASFSICPITVKRPNGAVIIAQMIKKMSDCFLVSRNLLMSKPSSIFLTPRFSRSFQLSAERAKVIFSPRTHSRHNPLIGFHQFRHRKNKNLNFLPLVHLVFLLFLGLK